MGQNWLSQKGYAQGVIWIILVSLISTLNDILMRTLGSRLDPMEIAFFRFFFSFVTLLPILLLIGGQSLKTERGFLHAFRAIIGFVAVALWCYGVGMAQLVVVSTMALTVSLFVLPMAKAILKETVGWQRILATLTGFVGILFIVVPDAAGGMSSSPLLGAVLLIIAAILFAFSDILNKVMVKTESEFKLMFYFSLGTTLAGIVPCLLVWQTPNLTEFGLLVLLGVGANLILYCLLKAFSAIEVSALAPYRYVELLFATCFGYILYSEIPTMYTAIGAAIIIASTLSIALYETKSRARDKESDDVLQSA